MSTISLDELDRAEDRYTCGDPLQVTRAFLQRFVAYPSEHCLTAHVLWIFHAHLMDAWESTPRLAFLSPEPGSGKTRALEVTELLVPRPVEAVNVTPAYLFRKVGSEEGRPTLLYDEIDTVFGPKAKDNEEIRGLLNAGHRKGAVAGRCVVRGREVLTEEIPAFSAVALAGLGDLPDTILSRSIVIRMQRRAPGEKVEPYRRRIHAREGNAIRDRISRWAALTAEEVTGTYPLMPAGVEDRDADVWEPLISVADAAGGPWPELARVAAVSLVTQRRQSTPSLGIRLLGDMRTIFGTKKEMTTTAILEALNNMDESPWGELNGKPLNDRKLAALLKRYEVKPKVIRFGTDTYRGYAREDLYDAWSRYLGSSPQPDVTGVTNDTAGE